MLDNHIEHLDGRVEREDILSKSSMEQELLRREANITDKFSLMVELWMEENL